MRRCECGCGCDYQLHGYAPVHTICGACLDNCRAACADCGRTVGAWRYRCRGCYEALTVPV